jgi:GH25 family lysozyme M1 (1,4-beta-N-acetylmuramidase)
MAAVALVLALAITGQSAGVLLAVQSQQPQVLAVQPTAGSADRSKEHRAWKKTTLAARDEAVSAENEAENEAENGLNAGEAQAEPDAELADTYAPDAPTQAEAEAAGTEQESEAAPPMLLPATPELEAEDKEQPARENAALGETNGLASGSNEANDADEQQPAESEQEGSEASAEGGAVLLTPEMLEAAGFDPDALEATGVDTGALEAAGVDADALQQAADATSGEGENCLAWLLKVLFGIEPKHETYSGWQTIDGKTYYYAQATNEPVTGVQTIDGKLYYFGADGAQQDVTFGVDVSRYQKNLDWQKLKNAGIEFVIVRIGYRGYGSGTLVLDSMYETHMNAAKAAGLRTGIYFFSQAINEAEAVEEAEACLYVLDYFGHTVDYPIYFDSEYANASHSGRADSLSVAQRTACAVAFCEAIEKAGYKAGVYASTNWFKGKLNLNALTKYSIWNAHYSVAASPLACDIWQSTGTGTIEGIGGEIDINVSYIG